MLKNLRAILYLFVTTSIGVEAATDHLLVNLGESTVEGTVLDTKPLKVKQYLGIPYAQPPIGKLRFLPTQPLEHFPHQLKAVTQPPACPQHIPFDFPFVDNAPGQSEDCLYLNIWAPVGASPCNPRAVMYWMYGGRYDLGSIRLDFYNGTELAALGDIVMVTVNYRLGALGFLTSNTKSAPGNAGLWDVLEGLRWVHKNIRAFGGDPNRITIAGESSGSIFVGLLSVSPLSRGLFRRQIMESRSPTFLEFDNTTRNEMISETISSKVGCSNGTYTLKDHAKEVVECLRKVDAEVFPRLGSETLQPQYGDRLIPFYPRRAIMKGHFLATDTLIGITKDEGSILTFRYPDIFGFYGEIPPHLNRTAGRDVMRLLFKDFSNPEPIVHYYLPDDLPEDALDLIERQIFQAYGDFLVACPTLYHAEKAADKGKDVYFYYWGYRASNRSNSIPNQRLAVPHFEEVQFVFGIPVRKPQGYQREDIRMSNQAVERWSNFVKNGVPSTSWPLFSRSSPEYQFFGNQSESFKSDFQQQLRNCDFWRPYFEF